MNFQYPSAFWLLLFLLVPILIHLFQFRRYKKIAFSNVAMLQALTESKKQKNRLKHLLILLSRCLFIIMLAFCLAMPTDSERKSPTQSQSLLILDNTASMHQIAEGQSNSILEEFVQRFNKLSEDLPSFKPERVTAEGKPFELYSSIAENPSLSNINLDYLLDEYQGKEKIIIASDFQKQTVDQHLALLKDSTHQYVLIPALKEQPTTLVYDSLWVDKEEAGEEQLKLSLFQTQKENVEHSIELNLNKNMASTSRVRLEASRSSTVSIGLSNLKAGGNPLVLSTDEASYYDDDFYAVLLNEEQLKVLYLYQDQADPLISNLFSDESKFNLSLKLEDNYNYQNLSQFEVVLIEIGEELGVAKMERIQAYLSDGKVVIFIPTAQTASLSALEGMGLQAKKIEDRQVPMVLGKPDYNDPFFKGVFKNENENVSMPTAQIDWLVRSNYTYLNTLDGKAFLSKIGQSGYAYFFSGPLGNEHGSFIRSALILPVFYKMAYSKNKENSLYYYRLDEEVLALSYMELSNQGLVKLKKGERVIVPDQRLGASGLQLILPNENMQVGIWALLDQQSDQLIGQIALNYPKSESTASYYSSAELKELFQGLSHVKVLDDMELSTIKSFVNESKAGFPLWKYFLVLALLCLLAEVLIIRFIK